MYNGLLLSLIEEEVKAGRVSQQVHPNIPFLSIFKYTDTCAFEKTWNPINRVCRGLILNTVTGQIVARSFPKFFNLGEMPESSLDHLPSDELFEVYEKLDGSMGSIYRLPTGELAVATPGSMDSDQAREATKMLSQYATTLIPNGITIVTEIIYPENRIVCNYGDRRALVVLAVFENETGKEWERHDVLALAEQCGFPVVKSYSSLDLTNPKFYDNQEGYVIRFYNGLRVKIKSPIYVAAHRFLTNISISRIIEGTRNGTIADVATQCPADLKDRLDDLTGMVNTKLSIIRNKIEAYFVALKATITSIEDARLYRKNCALWIKENVPPLYTSGVFLLLSNCQSGFIDWLWKITEEELIKESKNEVAK